MKLYGTVIGTAMALIALVNLLFQTAEWEVVLAAVVLCTAAQFLLDGLIAYIIHKLPDRYFGVDHPWYVVSERERALYKTLRVRSWKDRIWELGGLGGFSKKQIKEPNNAAYIEQFLIECNKGVLTHRLSYPIGFLPMLLWMPNVCAFTIALPVALVNLVLNILPTMALRYNTPKLKLMLQRMKRRQEHLCAEEKAIRSGAAAGDPPIEQDAAQQQSKCDGKGEDGSLTVLKAQGISSDGGGENGGQTAQTADEQPVRPLDVGEPDEVAQKVLGCAGDQEQDGDPQRHAPLVL